MTEAEAIAKAETGWWKDATDAEIVAFQLPEARLCMPFSEFHRAVESVLGRPVWTHEFADPQAMLAEWRGEANAPGSPLESLIRIAGPDVIDKTIVVDPTTITEGGTDA